MFRSLVRSGIVVSCLVLVLSSTPARALPNSGDGAPTDGAGMCDPNG